MEGAKGTILLTGANGGLGRAIVQHIVSDNKLSACHGFYTVRDANLGSNLVGSETSHQYDVQSLDLTKLDNVREVAKDVNARVAAGRMPPIRALILNAGFQDFGNQSWTTDGYDTTFAANYLGHWLLTLCLLQSIDKEAGRIIVLGSQAHDPNDKRNSATKAFAAEKYKTFVNSEADLEAIAKGTWSSAKEEAGFRGGFRRYGAAKAFTIMMMYELQQRAHQQAELRKLCVLGVDPGTMITGLARLSPWFIRVVIFRFIYPVMLYLRPGNGQVRPTQRSASDVLEAAFGERLDSQAPYFDGTKPFETSSESRDKEKRKLLWSWTARTVHFSGDETLLQAWQ